MCDITDCSSTRSVFRASSATDLVLGQSYSCEQASSVQCVTPEAPSPSPSPSISPSPSATPSTSPSPSVSPSASPLVQIGEACTSASTCVPGASCGCDGVCAREISIDVVALADDKVVPYMCGNALGPETASYSEMGTWSFTGSCTDLFLRVDDLGSFTGVAAAVKETTSSIWHGSKVDGSSPGLSAIAMFNPANTDFLTNLAYDYSAWTPAVDQANFPLFRPEYQNMLSTYGAVTWAHDAGPTSAGYGWYRVVLPFC